MRITINVSEKLGNDIKAVAMRDGLSVSAFVSLATQRALEYKTRIQCGENVLDIAGHIHVSEDVLERLCDLRNEDENRV